MIPKRTYLLLVLSLILLGSNSAELSAQSRLGTIWTPPDDSVQAQKQLSLFKAAGISYIELMQPVDSPSINLLDAFEFEVLIRSPFEFLTVSRIQNNQERLLDHYAKMIQQYENMEQVSGYGLLSHSQTGHPEFSRSFQPLLAHLDSTSTRRMYYFLKNAWYDLQTPDRKFGVYLDLEGYDRADLIEFDEVLGRSPSDSSLPVLFTDSDWLLTAIDKYPEFSRSLNNYHLTGEWVFARPDVSTTVQSPHWMVLLLIFIWFTFAVTLKYLPTIRPALMRYFLAHRFYLDDILHYRERSAAGSILMMISHAIFGGMIFYIMANIFISEIGLTLFFHYFPFLAITGQNYFTFFSLGLLILLFTQFIAILWLYLPAKNLDHVSQAMNLFSGILFLDYLIGTLAVTFYMAGGSLSVIIACILFLIIWFASFNISAVDISRYMGSGSIIYLMLTIGIHSILSVAVIIFILSHTEFYQILQLSLSV